MPPGLASCLCMLWLSSDACYLLGYFYQGIVITSLRIINCRIPSQLILKSICDIGIWSCLSIGTYVLYIFIHNRVIYSWKDNLDISKNENINKKQSWNTSKNDLTDVKLDAWKTSKLFMYLPSKPWISFGNKNAKSNIE